MTPQEFSKGTDKEETIKAESALVYAVWKSKAAICGGKAAFEVGTSFVGFGAPVEVTGKSEAGEKLGTIKGKMAYDRFAGAFAVPEELEIGDEIFFEVKLSKNGLKGESDRIPVRPAVLLAKLKWSATEARRGDILTLSADVEKGIRDGEEVLVTIYEYDADGAHDKIVELPATVQKKRIELKWEYEYHEDTDEIPTQEEKEEFGGEYNPPEYFFTIRFGEAEYGLAQESGLLTFKDFFEVSLEDEHGRPVADAKYTLHFADGTAREGTLDADGHAREEDVPPGMVRVEFTDMEVVAPESEGENG